MRAGVYEHYKGGFYLVLGLAQHTENEDEQLVIYVSLTGANLPGLRMRARPIKMFEEYVQWPDGSTNSRFKYVGDEIPK